MRAKFGMAKFDVEKIWYQFVHTTGKFVTKFQDCGTTSINREWLLLFPVGLWFPATHLLFSPLTLRQRIFFHRPICTVPAYHFFLKFFKLHSSFRLGGIGAKLEWQKLAQQKCAKLCRAILRSVAIFRGVIFSALGLSIVPA